MTIFHAGARFGVGLALLTGSVVAVGAPSAVAATPDCSTQGILTGADETSPYRVAGTDFDNNGGSDLAIGVPTADSGAGVIDVHYDVAHVGAQGPYLGGPVDHPGLRAGSDHFGFPSSPGDQFGASATIADVNDDFCDDLIVGAPGTDHGRGAVYVVLGTATGLASTAVRLTGRTAGEHFGASVAVAGRQSSLFVAAPDRTVDGQAAAGAVDHFTLVDKAYQFVETLREGHLGLGGAPERGDRFGSVLAGTYEGVAVGVPDESLGTKAHAGLVYETFQGGPYDRLTASVAIDQNTPGVGGTAEAGDRFGAALDEGKFAPSAGGRNVVLAVGSPGESDGKVAGAGVVQVLDVTSGAVVRQMAAVTQESPTIEGTSATGDHFGASVLFTGVYGTDPKINSSGNLVIGTPDKDVNGVHDAGVVTVTKLAMKSTFVFTVTQALPWVRQGASGLSALGGTAETGDRIGAALASVAYPAYFTNENEAHPTWYDGAALVIDAPGEDVGSATDAGNISLYAPRLCPNCTGAPYAVSVRDSDGPATNGRYGAGAAGGEATSIVSK